MAQMDADAHPASEYTHYIEGGASLWHESYQLRDFDAGAFTEILGMKHGVLSS